MESEAPVFLKAWQIGMSVHVDMYVDINNHYDVFEDVYIPGEFKNPDASRNTISLE